MEEENILNINLDSIITDQYLDRNEISLIIKDLKFVQTLVVEMSQIKSANQLPTELEKRINSYETR